MNTLRHILKRVLLFGLLSTTVLLLVACPEVTDQITKLTTPTAVAPKDFKVTTAFSASEPKLIVQVDDLDVEGLQKLEYKLERFSGQCNDSDKVFTGIVPSPSAITNFDIATENYGAFKLSVTGTYDSTKFQNPVKTILPTAPDLDNPPANVDLSGLVFVDVLDDRSNAVQQIHLPDADGNLEFAVFNFSAQLEKLKLEDSVGGNSGIHEVVSTINPIGDKDRKWCSSDGIDVVAQNNKILNSGEQEGLEFVSPNGFQQIFGPTNDIDPIVLRLVIEPDAVNGNRAPFAFFNLVVHKVTKDGDGKILRDADGKIILGDEIYNEDHVIQDCATKENPLSELTFDLGDDNNLCFDNNDFPR